MEVESNTQTLEDKCQWFAMRTLGRLCEVAIKKRLSEDGIRYFQAMHNVVKMVKGKKQLVEVPIVANLIFVYGVKEKIREYTEMGSNFQFIYNKCSGKQADCIVVPTKKMNDFIRVVESRGENANIFTPGEVQLSKGQRVRIIGGPLDTAEGIFVKMKGARSRKFVIVLEGFMGVSAEVSPDMIEVLE